MGWKGYSNTMPLGMQNKTMYCKNCGTRLKIKKNVRNIRKGDRDFDKDMMFSQTAIGMSSYDSVSYTYQCPICRLEISYAEQCYVAKEQQRTNKKILEKQFANNEKVFSTQTAPRYHLRPFYISILLLLLVGMATFSMIIQFFQDLAAALSVLTTFLILLTIWFAHLNQTPPVFLIFYGTRLHVRDKFNVEFDIYSLTADDFLFKQNAIEKRKNIGHLRIRNSDYKFVGIENFAELVEYVKENF